MTDIDLMIKGLRLAWISRLLNPERRNWKSVPNYFFTKLGRLNFFLRCNYDAKYLDPKLPIFYKDILSFFSELKSKYNYQQGQETILFNNKESYPYRGKAILSSRMVFQRNHIYSGPFK